MCDNKKKVLLCIGETSENDGNDNEYKKNLLENNFECSTLQVLTFNYINLNDLENQLLDFDSYQGLILTSPRAVAAISLIQSQDLFQRKEWIEKLAFCVGQTTENAARKKIGLLNILGTDSGNAKNLAQFIIKTFKKDFERPLIFPCSNLAQNTLPHTLSENDMDVKKIIVYETKAHDLLRENLELCLKQSPSILVFFSPSIVDNIIKNLSNEIDVLKNFKIVAIGPVTEQALHNNKIQVHGVAEKPDPISLTKTISRLCNS